VVTGDPGVYIIEILDSKDNSIGKTSGGITDGYITTVAPWITTHFTTDDSKMTITVQPNHTGKSRTLRIDGSFATNENFMITVKQDK